jgi:hypothetical protein
MEQTLIRLLKLNFDLDDFYSISIHPEHYPAEIVLQGHPTPEKLLKYTQLGYSFISSDNGKFSSTINKISITLY